MQVNLADANIVADFGTILKDFKLILAIMNSSRRNFKINAQVIFILHEASDRLTIHMHLPGLFYILLPQGQRPWLRIGFGLESTHQPLSASFGRERCPFSWLVTSQVQKLFFQLCSP